MKKLNVILGAMLGITAAFSPAMVNAHETASSVQAPIVKNEQVAGFFRLALDKEITVTALYDGPVNLPNKWLRGISLDEASDVFKQMFLPLTEDGVQTSVNAYLVNLNGDYTLIDAGAAKCFGDELGHIVQNLKASGVEPEQIKNVVVTHLHPDHACGVTTPEGKMAFPNATLYAPQEDADYWLGDAITQSVSEHDQAFLKAARVAVAPYQQAERFKTFQKGENPIAGIETVEEFGHSPGMTGYLIGTGENRLLVWGDIIHSHTIQLKNPEISVEVDSDQPKAIATRKRILQMVEEGKLWVGAAHLPFPGMGHIIKQDVGYRWIPVEYLPVK